jgi:hypothetical protein
VTATSYARSLLELARDLPRARRLGVVLAMARPTDIECRLNAILRAERSRAGSRALRVVIAGAMAVAVILAASGRISAVAPESAHPIALSDTARPEDSERAVMRLALDSSSDVVPTLIDALQHRDAQVREKAALGLAWRNDARVLPALTRAVRDADSQVREKVAIALGSAGHPGARDGLLVLLNDPDDQVREKASAGLVLLGMMAPSEDDTRRIRDGLRTVVNGLLALANR